MTSSRIALIALLCVGCQKPQPVIINHDELVSIVDSVSAEMCTEHTQRIARLAADSASRSPLTFEEHAQLMYRLYDLVRDSARCVELLRKDPAKGLSGCCNAHHADCPSRNRGEIGEACADHFVDANKKVDTCRWFHIEGFYYDAVLVGDTLYAGEIYSIGRKHNGLRLVVYKRMDIDSIWHCEPRGGE